MCVLILYTTMYCYILLHMCHHTHYISMYTTYIVERVACARLERALRMLTYADIACAYIYVVERVACARLQRALPPSRPYTTTCVSSYCILLCTITYYNICVLTLNISVYYSYSATYIVERVACARLERALPCSSPCFPRFPILSVAPGAVYE